MLAVIFITFVICFIVERLFAGWTLPRVRGWPIRVLVINACQLVVVVLGGITWEKWFQGHSLLQLPRQLGDLGGGLLAYFVATFIFYWWHRFRHESDFLWRIFHQIHHSPQRLEVITSFYKHPVEMVVNSTIGSLLVYVVLGLSPIAGAYYTLFTALGEFFYHTNIKTPRWIGYFFQRPEMHRIHHEYNRHKNNYGDITWWDMMFGTYENPKDWTGTCGFDTAKELKLGTMLQFKDVHSEKKGTKALPLGLILALALPYHEAAACSVVAESNSKNQFFIAKNFDWNAPEGLIVKNGRNTIRRSFNPSANINWVAKYSSMTFTTLGPGLPISGMNEMGLTVEALVDWDFKAPLTLRGHLTSLEWSQYLLDNFKNTEEVQNFSKTSNFDQQVVPLHFFVCDSGSKCLVIEKRESKSSQLKITSGQELKKFILANGEWEKDYDVAQRYRKTKKSYFGGLNYLPNQASSRRFAALFDLDTKSERSIFSSLNKARIPSLIQWQILWFPRQGEVLWRDFKNKKPGEIRRLNLKEHSTDCTNEIMVKKITGKQDTSFAPYNRVDFQETQDRVKRMIKWRTGNNFTKFEKDIVEFTTSLKCKPKV